MMKLASALLFASANAWGGSDIFGNGWGYDMSPYDFVSFDEFGFGNEASPYDYGY